MVKVACCDDQLPMCRYLKRLIEKDDELQFIGMAHNRNTCMELVGENEIDVLLLDIQLGSSTVGVDMVSELKKMKPDMKVIMLTMYDDEELILKTFFNGASDYVLKQDIRQGLIDKIKKVYNNENRLKHEISNVILNNYKIIALQNASVMKYIEIIQKLSKSEYEILELLSEGYTYRKIAKERYVSETTIRTHVHRILKKLNVKDVEELIKIIKNCGGLKKVNICNDN